MKKLVFYFAVLLLGITYIQAETGADRTYSYFNYGKSFIFVENGITFSVYPDGEFDFYINNRVNVGASVGVGYGSVTFNSGFNYNPYVQFDDYGAVIQVENVPIFYDYYGRVSQIGGINVWYRNGFVRRIGGLRVYYNNLGYFDYCTGYINVYNRYYVYRPFHGYFIRPAIGFVYTAPYRRYYYPVRYTYYAPYRHNYRRYYATVGERYHYYDRGHRRSRIYRNDRRVAVRDNGRRNEYGHVRTSGRNNRSLADSRTRTVNRSSGTRVSDRSRSQITRPRVARSSENGNRRTSRTVANRERTVERSTARSSKANSSTRTNRSAVDKGRKQVTKRSQTVTRTATNNRNKAAKSDRSRSYSSNRKSSEKVTSRPKNRTSGNRSLASNKSSKKKDARSTKNRSSNSRSRGNTQRSNSRRVK